MDLEVNNMKNEVFEFFKPVQEFDLTQILIDCRASAFDIIGSKSK